jgi:hypothetical protein
MDDISYPSANFSSGVVYTCQVTISLYASQGRHVLAGERPTVLMADGYVIHPPVTPGRITVNVPFAQESGDAEDEEIDELPTGSCAIALTPHASAWTVVMFALGLMTVYRRGRKAHHVAGLALAVILCAARSDAQSPADFFVQDGFQVLQTGTPDPRVTNSPDYPDAEDEHSWEAYDIEHYGSEAIAQLAVIGSSFISVGTIDVGVTPQGMVMGEIYLQDGSWVAHLEGALYPDGVSGFVLAQNGEIDAIDLSAPGLAQILAGIAQGQTPTPTATAADGSEDDGATSAPETGDSPTPTSPPPTPTAPATATATPVCAAYHFTTAALSEAGADGTDLSCTDNPTDAVVQRSVQDGVAITSEALLRWDTSALPDDWVMTSAALHLHLVSASTADAAWVAGDYHIWSTCDAQSDYSAGAPDNAFGASTCGTDCTLASVADLTADSDMEWYLNNLSFIHADGETTIRLHVDAHTVTGGNELHFVGPQDAAAGPELIVWMCDPSTLPATPTPTETPTPLPTGTPTPMPPDGCQYLTFTTSQEYFNLAAGQDGPQTPLWCSDNYGLLPVMNVTDFGETSTTTVQGNVILRWDTSSIPDDLSAAQAWLRFIAISTGVSSSTDPHDRSLHGDWYDPQGTYCALSDFDTGSANALSVDTNCGAQCDLANVVIGMDTDFALSSPASGILPSGAALRLWVPNGGSAVANHLLVGGSFTGLFPGPRLVVLACERPLATPTPTEILTPTPTAEPPQGCAYVEVTPAAVYMTQAVGTDSEPVGQGCVTDSGAGVAASDSTVVNNGSATNTASNIILTFDTDALPADRIFFAGVLRAYVVAVNAANSAANVDDPSERSVYGEWLAGAGCSAADHANDGDGSALSQSADCGSACDLSTVGSGGELDLPLTGPSSLDAGSTRLRLRVPPGNMLRVASGVGSLPGPRLILLSCQPPPTPVIPTPSEGCETRVIDSVSDASDLVSAFLYPDAGGMCYSSLSSSGPIQLLEAGLLSLYYDPNNPLSLQILLRWPTGALPADMNVTAAWLRLLVASPYYDADATLVADWYGWGPTCDNADAAAPATDPALSGCGASCLLSSIQQVASAGPMQLAYIDLPLDTASTHIARGQDATTDLRVGVSPGETTTSAGLVTVRSSTVLPGPGLVVQLCPTP